MVALVFVGSISVPAPDNQNDDLQTVLEIDETIHSPVRLAILIFLLPQKKSTFPIIRNALGLTGGNLSAHLTKLANAGLIEIKKMFVDAKPATIVSINDEGRAAITDYAANLSGVLNKTLETMDST
ncbi:MAG: transcriptional regulator [Candidatus Hodarchaeota archaeon]